jgi:hypothetical protein
VKAYVAPAVTELETLQDRGQDQFRVAGRVLDYSNRLKPQKL